MSLLLKRQDNSRGSLAEYWRLFCLLNGVFHH
nr:MAG TPA: hypothetical protein [Bacteriophage sp.]